MYKRRKRKSRTTLLLIMPFGVCAIILFRNIDSTLLDISPKEIREVIISDSKPLAQAELPHISNTDNETIAITNTLTLINTNYGIADFNDFPSVPANNLVKVSSNDVQLNETVLHAVDMLFNGASANGFRKLYISSGVRDYAKQAELYNEADDKSYVQPPGYSEHHTGLALDIADMETWSLIDGSPQSEWLKRNAHKYGFILRYPADKVSLTGISYEPWHYRYVGIPHAYYMYENGLCFEEYIDLLKQGGKYQFCANREKYSVWYSTEKAVSASGDYEISQDNTGGYIITMKGD